MWSSLSPLEPQPWFEDAIDDFVVAYQAAVANDLESAIGALGNTRERDLNAWFDLHAQNTGTFRSAHYGTEQLLEPFPDLDPLRSVTRFEKDLFARDGYRCRYCGVRVLPGSVTKKMQSILGKQHFDATSRSNHARHGIKLVFSASLDHVVPHSRGGQTNPDNLVTACWACNYGKSEYTLAEMGLDDPRDREPRVDDWQGLTDVPVCQGCGSGRDPALIFEHSAGGLWHTDFCLPPPDWTG
jgi:DNA-directed RNA polymerase subunit RPC12/RpoP